MQVPKNMIFNFISDYAGQGTIRTIWPFSALNAIYAQKGQLISQQLLFFPQEPHILNRARTLYFQRQFHPSHVPIIMYYKNMQHQFKYKMVWEMDDMIWGFNETQGGSKEEGIPSYNKAHDKITAELKAASIEIMNQMDLLTFSTQYLADYVRDELGVTIPSTVVPNTVPMAYWGQDHRADITKDIKKPKVIYTGSPTHYNNQEKLLGDWDNSWKEWVIKSVKNDEIDFTCFGGLPWFFEEIKDKIKIVNWVQSFRLHLDIKAENADFCINPLTPNQFNYSKSDLKLVESSAGGIACVGTTFTNDNPSPYDECKIRVPNNATVEDIDKIMKPFYNKDKFNEVIKSQYKWMSDEGRYTEHAKHINKLVKVVT